jgi:hypothetical protein
MLMAFFYILLCFLTVLPWLVRNKLAFGYTFLETTGYTTLLSSRAAGCYSSVNNIPIGKASEILSKKARSTFGNDPQKDPIGYKKHEAKLATSIIRQHPFVYIKNNIIGVFYLFFKPLRSSLDLLLGFSKTHTDLTHWGEKAPSDIFSETVEKTSKFTMIVVIVQLLLLGIVWLSFVYGMVTIFTKKEFTILWLVILVVGYFCIMSGGPEAYARFRVPIVPIVAIASGIGLARWHSGPLHR